MKTKLGISVGLFGALLYLSGLFSGYIVLTLLAGYVLLFEQNEWLKRTAVKAYAVCLGFSILSALVGFIPNAVNLVDAIASVFNGTFYIEFISKLVNLVQLVLTIAEKVVLLLLAYKAMKQGTVKIKILDNLVDNECGKSSAEAPRPEMNETKLCNNCGARIPKSAEYCPQCGKKG